MALGQSALAYLDQGDEAGKQLPTHDYLRGRLSYRLGALFDPTEQIPEMIYRVRVRGQAKFEYQI